MIINLNDQRGYARAPGKITSNFQFREIDVAMRIMVKMVIIVEMVIMVKMAAMVNIVTKVINNYDGP